MFVLAGKLYLNYLIDGSFFVPYFTLYSLFNFSNKDRCTACLYGMVSRIIMLSQLALPRCFPKASAKVVQLFETANKSKKKFAKKIEKFTPRLKRHTTHALFEQKQQHNHLFFSVLQLTIKRKTNLFCTTMALPYLYRIIPI